MAAELFAALVHHPVLDRRGRVVTAAVTSLDVHDLARSARTYGVAATFVVHPTPQQRAFARRLIGHWLDGPGRDFDGRRREALLRVEVLATLAEARAAIRKQCGVDPTLVFTSARERRPAVGYDDLRRRLQASDARPALLLFGTGFGLAPALVAEADLVLAPLCGSDDYNHLSVRAASAVILDRLRGR